MRAITSLGLTISGRSTRVAIEVAGPKRAEAQVRRRPQARGFLVVIRHSQCWRMNGELEFGAFNSRLGHSSVLVEVDQIRAVIGRTLALQ